MTNDTLIQLSFRDIKALLASTLKEKLRFAMHGVAVYPGVATATNGRMLLSIKRPSTKSEELALDELRIVPGDTLKALLKEWPTKGRYSSLASIKMDSITLGDIEIPYTSPDKPFPPFKQVLPKAFDSFPNEIAFNDLELVSPIVKAFNGQFIHCYALDMPGSKDSQADFSIVVKPYHGTKDVEGDRSILFIVMGVKPSEPEDVEEHRQSVLTWGDSFGPGAKL